jgi:hypothetical protein
MTDGKLSGRASGKPVTEYQQRHGKLAADEIPIVLESLSRVLSETRPTPKQR